MQFLSSYLSPGFFISANQGKNRRMIDFAKGAIQLVRGGQYPHCHSVLIEGRTRGIIDAASDRKKLQEFLNRGPVDYLITSHAHEDHLSFNYLFPQSKFCVHHEDAPHFENLDSLIDSWRDMPEEEKEKWRAFLQNDCHYQARQVDLRLQDEMVMDLGEIQIQVIHTPGHTPGHCAFYFLHEKILFTADLDLTRAGPYYADRGSDIDQTIRSLERLKTFKVETYLTSHGKGILEGDPEYIDRYLAIIFIREEKLMDFLRKGPKTLEQIVKEGIIYGNKVISGGPWDLTISERMMISKHLSRLMGMNRVRREGDLFILTL
jgi:hydroxyacylglutathione hydrolase